MIRLIQITSTIWFVATLAAAGNAQSNVQKPNRASCKVPPDITAGMRDSLLNICDSIFSRYEATCSLKDEETPSREVTPKSLDDFLELFELNANVLADFRLGKQSLLKAPDYAADIYQYMRSGLPTKVDSAAYDSMNYDPAGRYRIYLRFQKTIFRGLDQQNKVITPAGGEIRLSLRMSIFINDSDFSLARIVLVDVAAKTKPPTGKGVELWAGLRLGSAKPSFTRSDQWLNTNAQNAVNIDASSFLQFGFGVRYPLKNLPVSILGEVYLGKMEFTMTGDDIYYEGKDSLALSSKYKQPYTREVTITGWQETMSVNMFEAALGVGYSLVRNKKMDFSINAFLCPGKITGHSNAFTADTIRYAGEYKSTNSKTIRLEKPDPYKRFLFGADSATSDDLALETKLYLNFRIQPRLVFRFNNALGCQLGIDYTAGLGSWFAHEAAPAPPFFQSREIETSLLGNYLTKFTTSQIAFLIGLNYTIPNN